MSVSGTTLGPELLLRLDRGRPEPLHRQLAEALRGAIRAGRVTPGSRMPSTRVLADDLGVSRRLVVDTYGQLVAEGFLVSKRGSGTLVARVDTTADAPPAEVAATPRYDVDFVPGAPDLAGFPRDSWLRALRQGLSQAPSDVFGYIGPQGIASVRAALSEYLGRTRGVVADPARIVICSGVTQGLGLIGQLLRRRGAVPLAMEDPGFWIHRIVLQHNEINPVPVRVDDEGIDVAAVAETRAATVLTTPAHQSPTGVVLTSPRRAALLEWSRAGNFIIEDDYDAEYRYDRAPVGALQGLAPDRVIYFGSASKTLVPGLRMGWMVLPPELVGPAIELKSLADAGNSVMDQIAFAQLLTSGGYDRHLRQMRRRYLTRRNALLAALSRYLPQATVLGAAAGVHLTVVFPSGYPIRDLVRRAAQMGVRVESLTPYYADHAAAPPGLMLGYANLTESQIIRGIKTLSISAA
ncbi:MAG: PLP-dependent aminotransferase family protein [Mycobacterium sp.]|uniref:MocR-like pyridoxine biosynthesis transcription factor PdxR n=1 Tax=Mycobacterium sp. TaxID=1785 RepID=UPI003C342068